MALAEAIPGSNFKRLKNREDSSDLDDSLTETFAATKSIVSKFFWRPRGPKTLKNFAKTSKVFATNFAKRRRRFANRLFFITKSEVPWHLGFLSVADAVRREGG